MDTEEESTTSTTEVPRIVGDPPADWVPWAAGVALLVAILVAGFLVMRRTRNQG